MLSQIPDEAREMFRRGFAIVSKLSDDKRGKIVARSIESLEEESLTLTHSDLQKELALTDQDAETALEILYFRYHHNAA